MTVRLRLALTVMLTGLAAALGVIATVVVAFQRFEQESIWQRADTFLERVVMQHDDLLEQHARQPADTAAFMQTLLLYEPGSQLYLLDADGTVLATTGRVMLPRGFKVALAPVRKAAAREGAYVMGDDPETMDADAVVAARELKRATIRPANAVAGYLYLVCSKRGRQGQQLALFGSTAVMPAVFAVTASIALATALAAWVIGTITRPLRELSDEVAQAAREGFTGTAPLAVSTEPSVQRDEFGRLSNGFHSLLATLHRQWGELKRLDAFRRESVSNLSHDLRSPLTATAACLETLQQRAPTGSEDRRLIDIALRNTHNAAALVRSLGDLAVLDEPSFRLNPMRVNLAELLDDVCLRFAERAAARGVALRFEPEGGVPLVAAVDIELFERAVANLLDNALKFTPAGGAVTVAVAARGHEQHISVRDTGPGIAAADLPQLFDRLYQGPRARSSVAPASSDEGKGLGLAIVRRIAELHGGTVSVASTPGQGTMVTLVLTAN
jgi:signal transduction histidine kinase